MLETVIEKLKTVIVQDLDVNIKTAEIDADVSLFEDGLGLDSVVIVELIAAIEEQFTFQFAEDELNMELFSTLRTLAEFIVNKTK